MSTSAQNILDSFERLPDSEKLEVASEIIRRTAGLKLPPLSDEELTITAEELFLELDKREPLDEQP
ncbi:MAG TPA: hypothetical protein VID27_16980 [Blastocatellia bacterium]